MKGIAFHWDPPHRDVYSGMDPYASAWAHLGNAFGLEMIAITNGFPFPAIGGVTVCESMDSFVKFAENDVVVLADYHDVKPCADMKKVDWLVFAPCNGWRDDVPEFDTWTYDKTPRGGYHAIHLAHIAAHIGATEWQ
jgi:hypothetical protein